MNKKEMNYVTEEMDRETLKLIEENEAIIDARRKDPEYRRETVEYLYNRIMEITSKVNSAVQTFEAGEGEDVALQVESEINELQDSESKLDEEPKHSEDVIVLDLKMIRRNLGLNQIQMASKLGVSQGLISQVESGRTPVSKKMMEKLVELKVS